MSSLALTTSSTEKNHVFSFSVVTDLQVVMCDFAFLQDTDIMGVFNSSAEAKRFTFFKSYNGSTHTFESATFPGWYLCSPVEAHKPLTLTSQPGEAAITDFYFHHK